MNRCFLRAPLAVLPLAILATFSHAQTSSSNQLAETVVTATRFSEALDPLPMGVTVITADDIRASGATTVNEAVMRLLGVPGRVDLYGGGDYALDLRGFGSTADSNQVIVLDGVRLNEADLGGTRLAGINIYTVERIEVLRGNAAVLYGEGSTGGAIVIATKAGLGKERKNAASLHANVGTYNSKELRVGATIAAGGFSIDVAGQDRRSDNHRDNFESTTDGVDMTAQWSGDSVRFGVRHGRDALDTRLPGPLSFSQFQQNPKQVDAAYANDFASIRNERAGLFAEWLLGEWYLGLDAGWREKSLRSFQSGLFGYDIDAKTLSLKVRRLTSTGTGTNSLAMGHDANRWSRLQTSGNAAQQKTGAWYAKNDFTWASGTRLSAGVRSEKLDKNANSGTDVLSDRLNAWDLGLSQPINVATRIWARAGTSYRLANVDEFTYRNLSVEMRPQTSHDLEAGARWVQGDHKLELRMYRSILKDEIGYDPQALGSGPFDGRNVNFDPTRRTGLELDGDWSVSRSVSLSLRAALRQSEFRAGPYAGKDVPLTPRRLLALRVDWMPLAGHHVSGGVNWVGSQKPDFENQCSMPSYTTVDMRYAILVKNMEISFGVNNLFDRNYFTQAFSCSGGIVGGIYPEAGRTFTAAARLSF